MADNSQAALAKWKERLWDTYVRLESNSDSTGFYGNVTEAVPGSPRLTLVSSTKQITERTPANIRSDPKDFMLIAFQLEGEGIAEQGGRRAITDPGDFVLYESTHPYTLSFKGHFTQRVLRLPLSAINRRILRVSAVVGLTINGREGPGAIAREFVQSLAARSQEISAPDYNIYVDIAADLVATACLARVGELSPNRIRFERIRARLSRFVRDPSFDIEQLAPAESMSLRSLHRLFQLNGTTPGRVVLECRLEGIRRDLLSGVYAQTIGQSAFSWGFTDQSYFNKEFKKAFWSITDGDATIVMPYRQASQTSQ
jgi:AraC family transcriptional regulator, positive regulator of tynA and feaB